MPSKTFDCKKCNGHHTRPINSKCQNVSQNSSSDSDRPEGLSEDLSVKILQELQALSGRMSTIEDRVNQQDQAAVAVTSPTRSQTSMTTSEPESDLMLPTMDALKRSSTVQAQVDSRLRELNSLTDKGKFKSQRGGSETVWVKKEVPWPQNHILSGSNKSRISYDALSISQWVAGFSCIIREESDPKTRDHMLEYMTDLMEDSHDFGWSAAKASHAVLLCRMEEAKVTWGETNKIDRIRRAHAQRIAHTHLVHQIARKTIVGTVPPLANFTKRAVALTKLIRSPMATFTYMYVQTVLPREKTMPTQVRIAGVLHQKTNEALQQCSAGSQK